MDISIVIPVKNEEKNIPVLISALYDVMKCRQEEYEIIFVNDYSDDKTIDVLIEIQDKYKKVKFLDSQHCPGKDTALMRGFIAAKGKLIITMDGDMQNDPSDIPLLLEIVKNCDMVCGIRSERNDPIVKKKLSKIANWFRILITGDNFVDAGCAFRVMRAECVPILSKYNLKLFGAAHCFYPIILKNMGYKVIQIPVKHSHRLNGDSKFPIVRGRLISGVRACMEARRILKDTRKRLL